MILIRREGEVCYRVVVGQIHIDGWNRAGSVEEICLGWLGERQCSVMLYCICGDAGIKLFVILLIGLLHLTPWNPTLVHARLFLFPGVDRQLFSCLINRLNPKCVDALRTSTKSTRTPRELSLLSGRMVRISLAFQVL